MADESCLPWIDTWIDEPVELTSAHR
jgi:hypothetical protein